jgi:hypothetical protein
MYPSENEGHTVQKEYLITQIFAESVLESNQLPGGDKRRPFPPNSE